MSDGTLIVVDSLEDFSMITESSIRESLSELNLPILMLNKMDRFVCELELDGEATYLSLERIVEKTNVVIATYSDRVMGDISVIPTIDTVLFGSASQGWGFTLGKFASMYSEKFNLSKEKLVKYLWGNWFFDVNQKQWVNKNIGGLQRGFSEYVMKPIIKLYKSLMKIESEKDLEIILQKLKIVLSNEEKKKRNKSLLKTIFNKWLPISDSLLEIFANKFPSPVLSQKYRFSRIYNGNLDDIYANAIRNCDPNGPLMIYVTKMIPTNQKTKFIAFGRIFSGTIKTEEDYIIIPEGSVKKSKTDQLVPTLVLGNDTSRVDCFPCGSTIGIYGTDSYIVNKATITSDNEASGFKSIKSFASPLIKIGVTTQNPGDLPKLVESLKYFSKSELSCRAFQEERTGEYVFSGSGEFQLAICMSDFENNYCQDFKIIQSDPFFTYKETITNSSDRTCLAKSPNKHNRLYCTSEPLAEGIAEEIEKGTISLQNDPKVTARYLSENYGYDLMEMRKIWCFGPHNSGPNMLLDITKGVQYLNEIKESCIQGFQWSTREGILCEEEVRGMRLNLVDACHYSDAIHRGGGQIIPPMRRVTYACQLTSQPSLQEAVYLAEITTNRNTIGGVYSVLNKRRGIVIEEFDILNSPLCIVKSYLPVSESYDLSSDLRFSTGGSAIPYLIFDHYSTLAGDVYNPSSLVSRTVKQIRLRKGMKEDLPALENYLDKL